MAVGQPRQRVGLGALLRLVQRIADRVQLSRRLDERASSFVCTRDRFGQFTQQISMSRFGPAVSLSPVASLMAVFASVIGMATVRY